MDWFWKLLGWKRHELDGNVTLWVRGVPVDLLRDFLPEIFEGIADGTITDCTVTIEGWKVEE